MPRETFVLIGRYARKIVDGRGVQCRVCSKIINYDPATKQELRHSCQLPDHPDDPRGRFGDLAVFDDEVDEDEWCPEAGRLERGFDMLGYGSDMIELTCIVERW
jgi:hypothetical protein